MRFYHVSPTNKGRKIQFLKGVNTPAQARKHVCRGWVLASVTTILEILPNAFLKEWGQKQLFQYAKDNPEATYEDAAASMFGFRVLPDGRKVGSGQFGTAAHKELEKAFQRYIDPKVKKAQWPKAWSPWLAPVINGLLEKYEPVELEMKIADPFKYKTCGTIDCVARNRETDKFELLDFKCRNGKGDIKTKSYDKDAPQIAVEAEMLKSQWDLTYTPRISNILIDAEPTGEWHQKEHTLPAQKKALAKFDACTKFYNSINPLNEDRLTQ